MALAIVTIIKDWVDYLPALKGEIVSAAFENDLVIVNNINEIMSLSSVSLFHQ